MEKSQKNRTTVPEQLCFFRLLLLLLLSVGMKVYAQVPIGSAYFENCYQSFAWGVSANDTLKVRLLDSPSGRSLKFSVPVNPLDINGYLITYFQEINGSFFPVSTTIVESNGNLTIPVDVPMIQINPINNTGGWAGFYPAVATFVSPDSAFNIVPNGDECFTFESFNFLWTTQLDGLCKAPYFNLRKFENGQWLPYVTNVNSNQNYQLPVEDFCTPPVIQPPTIDPPYPRCTSFKMQIELLPCDNRIGDPDCPDPLVFEKEITICCMCDLILERN